VELDADILEYYDRGDEQDRLTAANRLELLRTPGPPSWTSVAARACTPRG